MSYDVPQVITKRENILTNQAQSGVFMNVGLIGVGSGGVSAVAKTVIRGDSGLSDYVDPDMSSAECSYLGFGFIEDSDFDVSDGSIVWKSTKLTSPYIMKSYAVSGIGSLPVGNYFYAVTAIKKTSYAAYGETEISNVVSVTLGVSGKAILQWAPIDLAEGYRVYRGSSASDLHLIREFSGGNQVTWEDTGLYTIGSTAVPVANTAYRRPPSSQADTVGYFTGGDASGNLAALTTLADGSISVNADSRGSLNVGPLNFAALTTPDLGDIATEIQRVAREMLGDLGYYVSGSSALNLANIVSVSDGKIKIDVDGAGAVDIAAVDFSGAESLDDVASLLQAAIRTATSQDVVVSFNSSLGLFYVYSATRGTASSIVISSPDDSTDLCLSTYFNFVTGASVIGVIYAIEVEYDAVASAFIITSSSAGDDSSIAIAAGSTGTDISVAGLAALATGAATDGITGEKITYSVSASIQGRNYFEPDSYFDLAVLGDDHGYTSELYAMAKKMMPAPPTAFGAPELTVISVPEISRSTVKAALLEMGKVDVSMITVMTDNIDIARDIAAHADSFSRYDIKKERVAIIALDSSSVPYTDFVALALELNSERVCLVYDNYTSEDYVAPMVAAMQAGLVDSATSMLTATFNTDSSLLKSGRVDSKAVKYMLSQGVMVLSRDDNNVLTIIDDLSCAGPTFDLPGRLVEDELRKDVRRNVTSLKGLKRVGNVYTGLEDIATSLLDSYTFAEKIETWDPSSLSAIADPNNDEGAILRFTYTRMRTLKVVTVEYNLLG